MVGNETGSFFMTLYHSKAGSGSG